MNSLKNIITGILLTILTVSCTNKEPEAFAYGNFEADEVFISAELAGRIISMKKAEGEKLKSGEIIAVIDSTQVYLQKLQLIASRKAVATKLTQVERQLEINKVNKDNLERELRRFGSLYLEKAATRKQVDDLEGQLNVLNANEKNLESQKASVYAELATIDTRIMQAGDQLSKSRVRAPFQCTIIEKYAREGELATMGRKIVKLADLSVLNLRVFVQGDQLSSLSHGKEVEVAYDGPDGLEKTTGVISWISSEAEFTPKIIQTRDDRVSMVYAVKIRVENEGFLKVGMPGEINIME